MASGNIGVIPAYMFKLETDSEDEQEEDRILQGCLQVDVSEC